MVTTELKAFYCCFIIFVNNNSQSRITQISMITKATAADVSSLNKLINSAYRGEFSKRMDHNLLEGSRTNWVDRNHSEPKTYDKIYGEWAYKMFAVLHLGMVSPELQNSGIGKNFYMRKHMPKPWDCSYSNDRHISPRRTDCLVQTSWLFWHGARDFPVGDIHIFLSQPLEFMVLEKNRLIF
jgi:hypothetical protein